jgi:hypothetical protein
MELWQLFLDDTRLPPEDPSQWHIARSTEEAKRLVIQKGPPFMMSLDFDLSGNDRGIDFLKWLAYEYQPAWIPVWFIHSQNPVGARAMASFLQSWYEIRNNLR